MNSFYYVSKTPLRVSFFGGGTDFYDFYRSNKGQVLSSAINKYVYITVKSHHSLFNENYRLNYSHVEHVKKLTDIKNDIIRECLKLLPVKTPLYISIISDIPAFSGLGSSSSTVVGLLNILHKIRGENVKPTQLAQEACDIEIKIMKQPIGKQDQYIAAFGGFKLITFLKNRIIINKINQARNLKKIFDNAILVYTGNFRESKKILTEQKNKIFENKEIFHEMLFILKQGLNIIKKKNFSLIDFANLLNLNWLLKKKLASKISNNSIDNLYQNCLKRGALGGKILGAGGGGFLFLILNSKKNKILFKYLKKYDVIKCSNDNRGSRIVLGKVA